MNFNPEWILNPLTTYAVTGTGLLALLFLWFSAKMDASRCRHQITAIKEGTDSALQELAAKVNEIAVRPTPEPAPVAPTEIPHITQSLNLTRRTRALHMRRRGDEPHTIAAALGISQGEVELLLKLDQILRRQA